MDSEKLEYLQEKMFERQELEKEEKEINEICARNDLKCPYCKVNPTKASKRKGGMLLPCKKCYNKRIQLFKYGLSLKTYLYMLNQQNNKCAICNKLLDLGANTHIDHCHDLGHNRGILCKQCNSGIGSFQDNEDILENAIKYLKFNRVKRQWWYQKYNTDN